MTEWRLIDTAPKTGETILLIADNVALPESCAAAWHELFEGAGYWRIGDPFGLDVEFPEPTHWMPMPTLASNHV